LVIPEFILPALDWKKDIPTTNIEELTFAEKLTSYLNELKEVETNLKTNKDALCEIWAEADKLLKLKNDKAWAELELTNLAKILNELQQNWKAAVAEVNYWHTNINWLQSRFPDAKYVDIVGLCRLADKKEYVEEQDYSLNAGRYVGVEIEGENITREEFINTIERQKFAFEKLANRSNEISLEISKSLNALLS